MKKNKITNTGVLKKAMTYHQNGEFIKAKKIYQDIISSDPNNFNALQLLGTLEAQNSNFDLANTILKKALDINGQDKILLNNIGGVSCLLKRYKEAIEYFNRAIYIDHHYYDAHYNKAEVYQAQTMFSEAIKNYQVAIQINDKDFRAHNNIGICYINLGDAVQAMSYFEEARQLNPNNSQIYNNIGKVLKLEKNQKSLDFFTKSIELDSQFKEAYVNLAEALKEFGYDAAALQILDKAISINISDAKIYFSKGRILEEKKLYLQALDSYEKAINLDPLKEGFYLNRGNVQKKLHRYTDALKSYELSKKINPEYSDAYSNSGTIYQELNDFKQASIEYEKALSISPHHIDALFNRGSLNKETKKFKEALADFILVYSMNEDFPDLLGEILYCNMYIANWDSFNYLTSQIERKIKEGKRVTTPFPCVTLIDNPEIHKLSAEIWSGDVAKINHELGPIIKKEATKKIKIGYYSADFYEHATSYLIAELFEAHDKEQFEVIAFSFGPILNDKMTSRLMAGFDQYYQVNELSDIDIAKLSRELCIDIAIDLKGYTQNSRPNIFAFKVAPIQVSYLGYPGTSGTSYMDYLIADNVVVPEPLKKFYSEKIIYLPNSYQVNDSKKIVSAHPLSKQKLGLPEDGFIFCSFNSGYKITPTIFNIWMKILLRVDGSVLWLLEENIDATLNLQKEAEKRGICSDRLIFAPRMSMTDHLQRYYFADLFLDNFPCNAHTTASDSLWCNLPLLTISGQGFASRVAASLLHTMNLSELVSENFEEYEEKAVLYASNKNAFNELNNKLRINKEISTLFNIQLFAKNLEMAYKNIYQCYHQGLPPEHIDLNLI